MPDTAIKNALNNLYRNPAQQFWLFQAIYWSGVCFVTFFTLTLWYGHFGWAHFSHTLFQGLMGLVFTFPLRWFYIKIWKKQLFIRGCLSLVALALVAAGWTIVRMASFIWISGETNVWADFGGWYFGAIFIFLGWGSLYHGIRYFQLLTAEHEQKILAETATSAEQLKRLKAESIARDAQMMMLRYQLNPHFLFNTLNAINALIRTEESDKAQQMIIQLSHFLRYSLDNNPDTKIALENEIEALMLYLEIEKIRFGERLDLDFEIEEEAKFALVPSLLLQPLIENSLKYAISKSETGGTVKLRARLEGAMLIMELSDTGPNNGTETSKVKSPNGRGIGVRNTTDRLKALYVENYKYDLSTSSAGGLKTTIGIPYETGGERSETPPRVAQV